MRPQSGRATLSPAGSQSLALRLAEEGGEVLLQRFKSHQRLRQWWMKNGFPFLFFFLFWKEWDYLLHLLRCEDLACNTFYQPKKVPKNLRILGSGKRRTVIKVLAQFLSSGLYWNISKWWTANLYEALA